MTAEQHELVFGLCWDVYGRRLLSREDFRVRWPVEDGAELGLRLLSTAITERSADDVWASLVVCNEFGMQDRHVPLLITLATSPWHITHEDVARHLQLARDGRAIGAFRHLARVRLPYLDHDDSTGLAIKALHGMEYLRSDAGRAALEECFGDDREDVRSTAERLRRRMG